VTIPCSLEPESAEPRAGTIVDISHGGAGIDTARDLAGDFTLSFEFGGIVFTIPGTVRHSRDLWGRWRLHVQFRGLTPEQHRSIEFFLQGLAAGADRRDESRVARLARQLLGRPRHVRPPSLTPSHDTPD
jgi:PilZ domain